MVTGSRERAWFPYQLAVQTVGRTFEHPPISYTTGWALRAIVVDFLWLSFLFADGLSSECRLQDGKPITCRNFLLEIVS